MKNKIAKTIYLSLLIAAGSTCAFVQHVQAEAVDNAKTAANEDLSYKAKANTALRATANRLDERPAVVQTGDTKLGRAKDFMAYDEHRHKLMVHRPGPAKDIKDVPEWVITTMNGLAADDLFAPDKLTEIQSEPDRIMLAKLIIRATQNNESKKPAHYARNQEELQKLYAEFDTELCNMGYGAEDVAKHISLDYDKRTKVRGEIRHHYVDHDGHKDFKRSDMRTRLRLYVEQPFAKDWSLNAMGEMDKSWLRDDPDGKPRLERLYIAGKLGNTLLRAGRFSEFYAEGNVYDGRMDGISFDGGDKLQYHAAFGRLRDHDNTTAVSVKFNQPKYDLEAGVYSANHIKGIRQDTVFSAGGNYYMGNFSIGAIALAATKEGSDGSKSGFVGTLRYGRNRSWIPKTYEFFAKYYDQAESTYFGHTMVGLADRMHGFKGVGCGCYYTIAPEVVYGIEYYDLKEKSSGKKGRTIWNHVSFYF